MPPKKAAAPVEKEPLGRPGNNVRAGVVGMPNVGKSTTFNIMCNMSVPAENFPFCTIDPTEARVELSDPNFKHLLEKFHPKSEVPAFLSVVDIAGLVKGAAEGEGLGNAFLSHINATDAIFNVVRVFEETMDGEAASHVEGEVDPIRDLTIIGDELRKKDIAAIEKLIDPLKKEVARDGKAKEKKDRLEMTQKILKWLSEDEKEIRFGEWTGKEIDLLNEYNLLTAKPGIFLVNMSEKDFLRKKNKWLPKLKAWLEEHRPNEKMICYSAAVEQKLLDFSEEEREAYCKEHGVQRQMDKIVWAGYEALRLQHFYTAGADEVKCWTIRKGWKAPQAAGIIHTDFERGFIKAEVYSVDEFKQYGSEAAVKEAGKYRQEGKNYVVQNGDIIFFKFNVTADAKKK